MIQSAKDAGLKGQGLTEIFDCWDMIQIWRGWMEERFGTLQSLRHRSDPDDPPDLELVFSNSTVSLEHTWLLPYPRGWADDLKRTMFSDVCSSVPSIASPPSSRQEMIESMGSIDGVWHDAVDEWTVLVKYFVAAVRKKMQGMPNGGIVGIVDRVSHSEHDVRFLMDLAGDFVRSRACRDFSPYVLILLSRWNTIQFRSALITKASTETKRSEL